MGHREFASAILIDTRGRLLLQQREDIAGIRFPGKIALFGGHREGDETFLECVVREVHEEISYFVPPERFEHLTTYNTVDADGGTVSGEMFVARDIPSEGLVITEGSLLVVNQEQLPLFVDRFAPSALAAVKAFVSG
jgi:8-oxo-dGTP diphosphatase